VRAVALSRIAFAALVAASIGALFYAQAQKRKTLLLEPRPATVVFAPSGTGVPHDRQAHFHLRLTLGRGAVVTVLTTADRPVKVVARLPGLHEWDKKALHWDGRTASGTLAAPGYYLVEIHLIHYGQTFIAPGFRLHLLGGSG
jgi:hypothetical protein